MHIKYSSKVERLFSIYTNVKLESKRHQRGMVSIIVEMFWLYLTMSVGPNYYLVAGMADKKMSWQNKNQHISDSAYHNALDILNPKAYRKLTHHKLEEKAFLQLAKIPTANFIGFYQPVKGFDSHGNPLINLEQVEALLSLYQGKKICIKIPEGFGGAGFFAGEVQKNSPLSSGLIIKGLNKTDGQSLKELLDDYNDVISLEGLLIETYIEQCHEYARFNPSSVNTVRIWVLQAGNNINVIGGFLRIGRKGSLTDNGDSGGILCPVNPITGKLSSGTLAASPIRDNFAQHCDNQVQIDGVFLTHWRDVIECSCETLRKLPYTRFAGLDVCMTSEGPLIIEVNVAPDRTGAAYGNIPSNLLSYAAKDLYLSQCKQTHL